MIDTFSSLLYIVKCFEMLAVFNISYLIHFLHVRKLRKLLSVTFALSNSGAGSFGLFSCVLDGVERQQSHRAVYR